jgi:hypothetical protein
MRFKIHYTTSDGSDDYFIASGDTIEEIREVATTGVEQGEK